METKSLLMVPSLRAGGMVEVDWTRIQRRLQRSQRKIDRARRLADKIERIIYRSFSATIYLWVNQNGVCPCCQKPITWRTGWSKHHIIPKSQGGKDALANLQLLHPKCHLQLHQTEDLVSRIEDIREIRRLYSELSSRLQRLAPVPPEVFEGWDLISPWLAAQAQERRAA